MKNIKLQLDIRLKQSNFIGIYNALQLFWVHIRVIDKDQEFESNFFKNKTIIHNSANGLNVKSSWNESFGILKDDEIVLPNLDRMGYELKKYFNSDQERYVYLRKLYDGLEDWSNYWYGFQYDSASNIILNGSTWTIGCNKRIIYQPKKVRHSHRDQLKRNLIF